MYSAIPRHSKDITDQRIDELYALASSNVGNIQLKFLVKDSKTNAIVKMPSRSIKVTTDNDFLKKIEEMNVFECKLEA